MNCKATTKSGKPCSRKAKSESEFCAQHSQKPKPETKPKPKSLKCYFILCPKYEDYIKIINETTCFLTLMKNISSLMKYVKSDNSGYDFDKEIDENEFIKIRKSLICNFNIDSTRRADLIMAYTFRGPFRTLVLLKKFTFYTVNPLSASEKEAANEYFKLKTSNESKTLKFEELYILVGKFLTGKDIKTYMKIIMTPTDSLRFNRKEILELYREFHPDKAENSEISQKLCTLICSKISILKKKLDGSTSPTRPIGNLIEEVEKIIKSTI